jgi:hypothetical protein
MRFITRMRRNLRSEDGGFSLVWFSIILVLLLGMAGFATDLGWIYLNTVRTQNAVDAVALAGVVNLPGFDPAPDAEAAARANGYDPGGADTLTLTPNADNQLHAELSTSVEPFFMKVLGFNQFSITREATAEYVKPVPLGSPGNCFGGGNLVPGCGGDTDFWAAVSGRRTKLEDGDPYSTECNLTNWNGSAITCTSSNVNYARGPGGYGGYYLAVDVRNGASNVEVWLFGGGFGNGIPSDGRWAADTGGFSGSYPDIETSFTLYGPDTTPLIPFDNTNLICSRTEDQLSSSGWSQMCSTIASPTPGIYVLHVESTNNSSGSNNFAVRAEAGGPNGDPRVYGLNDMSIWSNNLSATSILYLADIGEEHAGKILELEFYDPGDADAESWYRLLNPFGNVATCSWEITDHLGNVLSTQTTPTTCQWKTQTTPPVGPGNDGVYNKQWIRARINLPDDPADMCNESGDPKDDCFWSMDLDLAQPSERTVWKARVIGNPVRLLP